MREDLNMSDMNGMNGKLYAILDSVKKGVETVGETASNAAYMADKKGSSFAQTAPCALASPLQSRSQIVHE